MATPVDREKLKIELGSSREGMTAYVAALRHDLDFGSKLKRGVRDNPLAWYTAAGVLGLLLSKIPPIQRKVIVKGPKLRAGASEEAGKAAITVTILKFALDFAKPALLRWFKARFLGVGRSQRGVGSGTS
jgi:hypothetical protein